jgi:hypothetical protein
MVESVLDESAVLAESGAVWKVGQDVIPAHPEGMGELDISCYVKGDLQLCEKDKSRPVRVGDASFLKEIASSDRRVENDY